MISHLGFEPAAVVLVGLLFICVISDLLLDLLSVRLSLSTDPWQSTLWTNLCRKRAGWGRLFALQAVSARKGAFLSELIILQQLVPITGTGLLSIFSLSLVGFSLSLIWLFPLPLALAGLLLVAGIGLLFSSREEASDLGSALLLLLLFNGLLIGIDQILRLSGLWILDVSLPIYWVIGAVVFAVLAFQTLGPLLMILSFFHGLFFFSHDAWAILLVLAHASLLTASCGRRLRRRQVLLGFYGPSLLQILVAGALYYIVLHYGLPDLGDWLRGESWLSHWQAALLHLGLFYLCFTPFAIALLVINRPWRSPVLKLSRPIYFDRIAKVHSLALQLHFLKELWQQSATSFRAAFFPEPRQVAKEQVRWLADKDQTQALCIQLGAARSNARHVEQIVAVYRSLNQMELLGESLEILSPELSAQELTWFTKLRQVVLLQLQNESAEQISQLLAELEHSAEATFVDEKRRGKWTRWVETLQRQSLWPWLT